MESPLLVWIRIGDLRFHDNPAISYASKTGKAVLLLYIDDHNENAFSIGRASLCWLEQSLSLFSDRALSLGFSWSLRRGSPLAVIEDIIQEHSIEQVAWNRRYAPDLVALDTSIRASLSSQGKIVKTFPGNVLIEPFRFLNKKNEPYRVFTHFWNALTPILSKYEEAPFYVPEKTKISSNSLPLSECRLSPKNLDWPKKILKNWAIGEKHALHQCSIFTEKNLEIYQAGRDIPSEEMTSRLSPHLHFGEISVRRAWSIILTSGKKYSEPYLRQLAWREFGVHHLFHFPETVNKPFKKNFEQFPYRHNFDEIERWKKGTTGIPIVDAGMRQLWQTGWMHNRVRMIVGSYLVKHLLQDWKIGFSWFWDTLVDADLANNTLGWQWIAGCGADAAPYFRIFNPVLQGEKFDPDGTYVKKYVLELKNIPKEYIHQPWNAPEELRLSCGLFLGKGYPFPIIDLADGRKRALEAFQCINSHRP